MKSPILVESLCSIMEELRMAIEVLMGKRTCFICLDFNRSHGSVRVGDQKFELKFIYIREDLIKFQLGNSEDNWYVALYEDNFKEVKVAEDGHSLHICNTVAGTFEMRWAGSSATNRREEPLFLENAMYCAQVRRMSLEELLHG